MDSKHEQIQMLRTLIGKMQEKLHIEHQEAQDELGQLHEETWGKDRSALDGFNYLPVFFTICMSRISNKGYFIHPQEAEAEFRKTSHIYQVDIMTWYLSTENEYPRLKILAERFDYSRLLILEYFDHIRSTSKADNQVDSKPEQIQMLRTLIGKMQEKLHIEHQEAKSELGQLHEETWGKDRSALDGFNYLPVFFIVYVSRIADKGYFLNLAEAEAEFRKTTERHRVNLMSWYFSTENEYPRLKVLAERFDYCRLLILEYMDLIRPIN